MNIEYGMFASSQLRLHWQYEAGSPLFCSQSLTMLFCALAGYAGLAGDVGLGDGAGLPAVACCHAQSPCWAERGDGKNLLHLNLLFAFLGKVMVGLHCEQQARWPVTRVRAGS